MAATVIGLNLSKAYNVGRERVHALNDVSLAGCGKTLVHGVSEALLG